MGTFLIFEEIINLHDAVSPLFVFCFSMFGVRTALLFLPFEVVGERGEPHFIRSAAFVRLGTQYHVRKMNSRRDMQSNNCR